MSEQEISDIMVEAYKYQKVGDTSSAISSWQKLITLSSCPKDIKSSALLNIGNLHFKEGSNDLAIESIQKALEINANSSEALYCLGYFTQEKEDFEKAINYFKKALEINPNDTGLLNNIGNCFDRLHNSKKAIFYYNQAIKLIITTFQPSTIGLMSI